MSRHGAKVKSAAVTYTVSGLEPKVPEFNGHHYVLPRKRVAYAIDRTPAGWCLVRLEIEGDRISRETVGEPEFRSFTLRKLAAAAAKETPE